MESPKEIYRGNFGGIPVGTAGSISARISRYVYGRYSGQIKKKLL